MNRSAGGWTPISPELEAILRAAVEAARRTDGRFDPTVLRALEAAGYDRDFDDVLAGARDVLHPVRACGRWREIGLAPGRVRVPAGVGIDLGGFAKGWTVDRAASAALEAGLRWAMVNAGGDLRIVGDTPALAVAIEDPGGDPAPVLVVGVAAGALASSSVAKRAWGNDQHHLIDPRTGRPPRAPTSCRRRRGRRRAPPPRSSRRTSCSEDRPPSGRRRRSSSRATGMCWCRSVGGGRRSIRRTPRAPASRSAPGGSPHDDLDPLARRRDRRLRRLFLSVAWGLVASASLTPRRVSKPAANLFHAAIASTGLALLGLHVALLLVDRFVRFDVVDLLVPMASPYRPFAIALGVVAMYAMVAIIVTSWVRKRVGILWWRRIHLLAVPTFAMTMLHGLLSGTDSGRAWTLALYGATSAIVMFLVVARGLTARSRPAREASTMPDRAWRGDAPARPDGTREPAPAA